MRRIHRDGISSLWLPSQNVIPGKCSHASPTNEVRKILNATGIWWDSKTRPTLPKIALPHQIGKAFPHPALSPEAGAREHYRTLRDDRLDDLRRFDAGEP